MAFAFPVPTPIFPTVRAGFSQSMRPTFSSIVQTSVSGVETRSARQAYPLWEFELTFERLADETQNQTEDSYYLNERDLQQLCGLFLVCNGQYGRFYYSCPADCSRAAQVIAIGDGVLTDFKLVRTFGSGDLAFAEPIGGLDNTAGHEIVVYKDGTPVASGGNWSVVDETVLVFTVPPASGVLVTADLYYYYFCRFLDDIQDFDQFYHHLWQVQSLKFRSVKR